MPRRGPINPQGYYHVSTRGNFGRPLYETRGEHGLYLELYAKYAQKFEIRTLSWALMWNHNHFVVKLTDGGLSEFLRRVNHGFARRLNAAYGRTGKGHMVRHCFFAREIQEEDDLLTVFRYIDVNPVAAKLCRQPEDWLWSGYAATVGAARPRPFHDVRAQLAFFGSQLPRARRRYAEFVTAGLSPGTVTKASRTERAA